MAEPAKHYTVRKLAERWEVSEGHVYKEIARKKLGCIRIGNAIRIPEKFVIAYEQRAEECPEESENNQNLPLSELQENHLGISVGQKIAELSVARLAHQMKSPPNVSYKNL